jgi:hypothetical protein
MARGLKTRGIQELELVRARARRQHALKRIRREDCEWIVARLDEVEARIIQMEEKGDSDGGY